MGNRVDIEVGATDNASPVVDRVFQRTEQHVQQMRRAVGGLDQYGRSVYNVTQQMRQQEGAIGNSARKVGDFEREIKKLTSGEEFLAEGVQSLRGMLNALTWGTLIGAATAATVKIIQLGVDLINTKEKMKTLTEEALKQAGIFDRLADSSGKLGKAMIDQAAHATKGRYNEIAKEIAQLQEEIRWEENLKKEVGGSGFVFDLANRRINNRRVEIERLNQQLKEQGELEHRSAGVTGAAGFEQEALGKAFLENAQIEFKKKMAALELEGLGAQILAQAQADFKEKGLTQVELGRQILAQAQAQLKEAAIDQEALGRAILATAQMELKENAAIQERLGLNALEDAQLQRRLLGLDLLQDKNAQLTQIYRDQFNEINALIGLSGEQAQVQALQNLAMEFGLNLQQAATSALQQYILGHAKLGPAIRAAVAQQIAAKSALAAVEGLMAIGEGLWLHDPSMVSGGLQLLAAAALGGVVARQIAGPGAGAPAFARSISGSGGGTTGNDLRSQGTDRVFQLDVHVNALDPASVDWDRLVQEQIAPAFGGLLERGGSTGNVQITFERN